MADLDGGRGSVPPALVHYRPAYFYAVQRCASCVMFRPPGGCTLVAGPINRAGVCDRWQAQPKRRLLRPARRSDRF